MAKHINLEICNKTFYFEQFRGLGGFIQTRGNGLFTQKGWH